MRTCVVQFAEYQKMAEYDYSPEAVDRYIQTQARIRHWTQDAARSHLCGPETPPTPGLRSKALPNSALDPHPVGYNTDGMQTTTYDQTTCYGSQLNINAQTSDGAYVHQHAYRTTRRVQPQRQLQPQLQRQQLQRAPQTLEVPPVNYAPLARNPYPALEHFRLQGTPLPLGPVQQPHLRTKLSHARSPVPTLPLQSSNGVYAPGPFPTSTGMKFTASVPSLALPAPAPAPYPSGMKPKIKIKILRDAPDAVQHARPGAAPARAGSSPRQQKQQQLQLRQQQKFYTVPRAATSSATLHLNADPRSATLGLYADPRSSYSQDFEISVVYILQGYCDISGSALKARAPAPSRAVHDAVLRRVQLVPRAVRAAIPERVVLFVSSSNSSFNSNSTFISTADSFAYPTTPVSISGSGSWQRDDCVRVNTCTYHDIGHDLEAAHGLSSFHLNGMPVPRQPRFSYNGNNHTGANCSSSSHVPPPPPPLRHPYANPLLNAFPVPPGWVLVRSTSTSAPGIAGYVCASTPPTTGMTRDGRTIAHVRTSSTPTLPVINARAHPPAIYLRTILFMSRHPRKPFIATFDYTASNGAPATNSLWIIGK
ncbi:hypothetical protein C8R44DRAFT_867328 [Mycena epipterygia]|nr:hypothetical protein C8R44DRAFT_867328 [Mycena epipterygia]